MKPAARKVLFLCTGNSARSQMAEALLQLEAARRPAGVAPLEACSAGTAPKGVHPLTIAALAELGVDWRTSRSKHIEEFLPAPPDLVISVCDNAKESCPTFPARVERLHWPFEDPAAAVGSDAERLAVFRRVRDEIRSRIQQWISAM